MRYLLFLLLFPLLMWACDDELATSPSDQPTLSADTLHMGTLLAGNSSKTYQLKLYNYRSAELRLTSIILRDAEHSGFRMNVDGMNGTRFTNSDLLRIASGDSLFIFIEATFPKGAGLARHTDYIDINCNGKIQTIVLDAQSKDVQELYGQVIRENTTWTSGTEIQIFDSLFIPQGITLTLQDSVTLYMHDKSNIRVAGTLICQGQTGRPVTIRGDRLDNMFDNLPYDNLSAQWGSLYIDSTAQNCVFRFTNIRGMTEGICIDSAQVLFDGCRIKNSNGNLLTGHMTSLTLQNCELSNATGALLQLFGGWNDITHCTLANYNFAAVPQLSAICLSNADGEAGRYTPMHRCTFTNTLLWGRWHDPKLSPDVSLIYYIGNDSIFNFRFDHCLLHAEGTDDDDFIKTIWNQDPKFTLIDNPNYTFDFHLLSSSPAIGAGAAEGATICPTDLDGVQRNSIHPTIGCYETPRNP